MKQKSKTIPLNFSFRSPLMKDFEAQMNDKIIGQEDAKQAVLDAVERAIYPTSETKRGPIGTFLFIGPPGVGKTEVTRTVAKILLGSETAFTKIDCGQFKERYQRSRLMGSPPSYIGYSTVPLLSELNLFKHSIDAIAKNQMSPLILKHGAEFAIVLLDEFEKMQFELQDLFLAAFDEGSLTLDNGIDEGNTKESERYGIQYKKHVNLKKTLFIITSNAGSGDIIKKMQGRGSVNFVSDKNELNEIGYYEKKLGEFLRPEFLSRIEAIIPFRTLTSEEYMSRLNSMVAQHSAQLENLYKVTISLNILAKEKLLEVSTASGKGARLLNQNFEKLISGKVSNILASGQIEKADFDYPHIEVGFSENFSFVLKDINKRVNKKSPPKSLSSSVSVKKCDFGNSFISFQSKEVLPLVRSLSIYYDFREEADPDFIALISQTETQLKALGFTEIDLSIIKKGTYAEILNDLTESIYSYDGIRHGNGDPQFEEILDTLKKYIKNKFAKSASQFENKTKSYETFITEVETYFKTLLKVKQLSKNEIRSIISLVHKEILHSPVPNSTTKPTVNPVAPLQITKPINLSTLPVNISLVKIKQAFSDLENHVLEKIGAIIVTQIQSGKDIGDVIIAIEFDIFNGIKLQSQQLDAVLRSYAEAKILLHKK